MTIEAGTRLGPYEIIEPIGAGGMGEVYKAKDTRLERTVALKILPEHLTSPERRARFEREAKAISQLNHRHICTLYDVGQHEALDFLVMEYLEGETLAERLKRGGLKLDQSVEYGIEIADALDCAHRAGIVHRDLKPGNIMLTASGVKLLDFGLVKFRNRDEIESGSEAKTEQRELTREGTFVGTVHYMAPEQLEGGAVDERADIFALGAVLYEALSGRKAFDGPSSASVIASILEKQPDPLKLRCPHVPKSLEWTIDLCLQKEASRRWRSAHDVRLSLEHALSEPSALVNGPATKKRRMRALTLSFGLAILGAALAGAWLARTWDDGARPSGPVQEFDVLPPEGASLTAGEAPALSPNGRHLAFVGADRSGATLLWVRSFRSRQARPLAGTEGATFPFWSPDSETLAFFADGMLKKVAVIGGPVERLATATNPRGGAWSSSGVLLFSPNLDESLYRIDEAGGAATPATTIDTSRAELSHRLPTFLPDGRRFLYVVQSGDNNVTGLHLGSLDSPAAQRVSDIQSKAYYTDSGYLVYARESTLLAERFDPAHVELEGAPNVLAENIGGRVGIYGEKTFSVSETGVLASWSGGAAQSEIAWFDRSGERLDTVEGAGFYDSLSLSPDGTRLAYERWDPEERKLEIWTHDFVRGVSSPFARNYDWGAVWSPDGTRIAYGSLRSGASDIYWRSATGAEDEELLLQSAAFLGPTDWSSDGRFILFVDATTYDFGLLAATPLEPGETRTRRAVLESEALETGARLSPDGRWLAYTSNESGRWEVWVQSFPDPDTKLQVSNGGGSHPEWNPDGSELFYLGLDRSLVAVEIPEGAELRPRPPEKLFSSHAVGHRDKRIYCVSPDGQRFLFMVPTGGETAPITITLNWDAELDTE